MKIARSNNGMVVAAHRFAAEAGRELLAQGANAVEAAVGVSLVLEVVEPFASGLGGGGFMMISPGGSVDETVVLDGRGTISSLAEDSYIYPRGVMLPWAPKTGPMSATIPGLGRMLELALDLYGAGFPLSRLINRAVELAADGFEVSEVYAYCSALFESTVRSTSECARIFFNQGKRFKSGEKLIQEDLARSLLIIAEQGFEACYTGTIGKAMSGAINQTGPVWGENDLAGYQAKVRKPLWADVEGHLIATTPPPSRGGAGIIRTLLRYDQDPVRLAAVLRSVFHDLHPLIGDPDQTEIDSRRLVETGGSPASGGGTSHFVVVDSRGTIVTTSQTINHFFGSGVVAKGFGILINDDLADVERRPGHPNSIAPGRRPVSNMAPTIVFLDRRPRLALGTPGSLRIIPALSQVIGNVLFRRMDLEQAVGAGRVHWEDNRFFFEGDIHPSLKARARKELDQPVEERRPQDLFFGGVHGVEILKDGTLVGVADPRRDGVAIPL